MPDTSMNATGGTRPAAADGSTESYLSHGKGFRSWALTLDHKRIGVMYLVVILASFLAGGVMALLIRTELAAPGQVMMGADTYNRVFTLHGAIMIFLFIIPSIPAAIGNFVLPMMIGARDVAFPRLNLASFYLWVAGALFALLSIGLGGVDTGWTFYTPYSTQFGGEVELMVFGVFLLGFSSVFTGLNFIATIHYLRPRGMGWFRMPLMLWGLYATAIIQIIATPVLGITLLLLMVEKLAGIGIFDPAFGGDPTLFQHFFWFYSHPAVYIMILPAMGIMSEIIPVFSRKHIFGYKFIAYSSIAIAIISFLVWGHHMFAGSQSPLMNAIFSALTFLVAIPSAVKVFNWLATMYGGAISLKTPMLYAISFLVLFTVGGLTGLFLGALATDVHLHDTYFVVAHFHYVMMGGTTIAFLAGLHYWWPKMFGRMYSEKWGAIACALVFIGFNLTFFPQFVMGSRGMPRRYWKYDPEFLVYHQLSTIGSAVMGIGLLVVLIYLVHSLVKGRRAPANPWGAATLEWQSPSPPPTGNFIDDPVAGDPYEYRNLVYAPDIDGYVPTPAAGAGEHAG